MVTNSRTQKLKSKEMESIKTTIYNNFYQRKMKRLYKLSTTHHGIVQQDAAYGIVQQVAAYHISFDGLDPENKIKQTCNETENLGRTVFHQALACFSLFLGIFSRARLTCKQTHGSLERI